MTKRKKETRERRYRVELTETQLHALEHCCEDFARMIVGQENTYQQYMERAWEKNVRQKNNLEPYGKEWGDMRRELEEKLVRIKQLCWGMPRNAVYGIGYSEDSDILFDMYQAFRYQRFLDMSEKDREICRYTVLSDSPMRNSGQPLPKITKIED